MKYDRELEKTSILPKRETARAATPGWSEGFIFQSRAGRSWRVRIVICIFSSYSFEEWYIISIDDNMSTIPESSFLF